MSKPYLVYTTTGKIRGVLASKDEKKVFESQRDMTNYKIVKSSDDDLLKLFDSYEYNLGRYMSIDIRGFIMFPHEEVYMCETFESDIEKGMVTVNDVYKMASTYLKFEDMELETLTHGLVEILMLFKQETSTGVFISDEREGYLDLDAMIRSWIGVIDYGVLEDDCL